MKNFLIITGMMAMIIFGGGFLIRYLRDGDFYIVEFIIGIIGLIVLIVGTCMKNEAGADRDHQTK